MNMQAVLEPVAKKVNPTQDAIADAAQRAILEQGYKAMSFRALAAEVGIKSASVHYHFPTKADLVFYVMRRHREVFAEQLVLPKKKRQAAQKALNHFIDEFKRQAVEHDQMSIGAILLAEKSLLDERTQAELSGFYADKMEWLTTVVSYMTKEWMPTDQAQGYAHQILASLHGATLLVQATGDPEAFEKAMTPWRDLVHRL